MTDPLIANSEQALEGVITTLRDQWKESHYLRVTIKRGKTRNLDQNALFQVWARQYAESIFCRLVTDVEHEAMKYTLQKHCYADTGWEFLIGEKHDLFTEEVRRDRAKTSQLETGEMFQFMEWIQARGADSGLILESLGEYDRLKKSQQV